jgi:Arc/MetJ-type ribon-helix-helix transcriptional regulator
MLKAVRFDIEEHKDIIDYVENYRDKKNRPNHSEAIRFLMEKGLESLNKQEIPKPKQQEIDVESLKADLFNQLMSQIQKSGMVAAPVPTPEPVRERPFTKVNDKPTPTPKPKVNSDAPKVAASNPLLANLLGNSQR